MILKYTIIGVRCDYCGNYYPSTKDPIHFTDEKSAEETLKEAGWSVGEGHVCPGCVGVVGSILKIAKHGN